MGLTLPLSPAEPFLVRFNTLAVNAFTKPMHVLISVRRGGSGRAQRMRLALCPFATVLPA